jgi:hypothetical protein
VGATAEEVKSGHVRGEKLILRHAQYRIAEEMAREGEHHDEAPDATPVAADGIEPAAEVAVVELRLGARRRIVAKHRGLFLGAQLGELTAYVATQAGDAHGETMLVVQTLVDGRQCGCRQRLLDVVVEGGDLAVHRGTRTGIAELGKPGAHLRCPLRRGEGRSVGDESGGFGLAYILAHGPAVEAQGAGDLGDVISRLPVS